MGLQTETLAEYWNGSVWSYTKADGSGAMPEFAGGGTLSGVSCPAVYCTATGQGNGKAIAELSYGLPNAMSNISWEGGFTPSPADATSSSLAGVSCISTTLCTAVGNYVDSSGNERTLVESWSG